MGGVPKQRHTKSRRDKRRSQIFLEKPSLAKCPKCGKPVLPHTVCWNCGYYKGTEVIDVLKKLTKKERKTKEKEIKAKEKGSSSAKATEDKGKPLTWEELSKK
ncbi:MAG: 50S ribosomal protein L32 [Parcubacteria group bacterium CG1_02_39_15]|uniref:Large ribosomal subunit protein bL32 n=3 Tax=Candidatus Nealsoniibacteriota TaxID=1817911 RepID=A0A2G9YS88_9BACT|nr:MAG: 50S ribosomal protein L32 [Parcubacteria group bacterium CG1_02_39_15]PIP22088.1 MAG: 50S ribosomal protein L32 [Candidatus Nealsonbacteria bacterium CG23_combo_of_CG06-09_8_20_14_all_39_25]PIW90583.1 MAG: 50S ribosomal protein L32 [Candidatus Nealsonbacteria bacterium CG_4_8_14_3_um_filter_40_11]PIZ88425.1 MAG: 50S ribosomal protein L32 [Candidatus Nealsonbacteria bacterium CG_4_10_14_0_2_um_filter_39_15]